MKEKTVTMNLKELNRVKILEKLSMKQLSQVETAKQLDVSDRQVRRLQKRYIQQGAAGLSSCRRGKPSNNRLSEEVKQEAMEMVGKRYSDFGPTLAHEK